MDSTSSIPRPSALPRPTTTRLPLPKTGSIRATPSRDGLRYQSSRQGLHNVPLRHAASREQMSATPSKPRISSANTRDRESIVNHERDSSTGTVVYTPKPKTLRHKPSADPRGLYQPSRLTLRDTRADSAEDYGEIGTVVGEEGEQVLRRKPRPSLSERTMETLQNIPASPRRQSSFFGSESPMRPPSQPLPTSRPTSSAGPGTSSGFASAFPIDFRATTNTFRAPASTNGTSTPVKRPTTAKSLMKKPSISRFGTSTVAQEPQPKLTPGRDSSVRQSSPTAMKPRPSLGNLKYGSKTVAARPLKPRASVNGLFKKPSMSHIDQGSLDRLGFDTPIKKKVATFSNTSSEATEGSQESNLSPSTTASSVDQETPIPKKPCKATAIPSVNQDTPAPKKSSKPKAIASVNEETPTPRKSSMTVKEAIAKAKAAKLAMMAKQTASDTGEEIPIIPSGTFDFGLSDPFNQQKDEDNLRGFLRKRINTARTDGKLNISGMGFKEIPKEVLNMYNLDSIGKGGSAWAETVDLTRLVAADNELAFLPDDVFPDTDPRNNADDDEARGHQFGGLETLDLHGNILIALPLGLRRLELLTTLNISNNKLGNDLFEIVCQIPSLRELKVAGNGMSGALDPNFSNLKYLETLDVSKNGFTSLPMGLSELIRLRILNVSENQLKSIAFESLKKLPLVEILASKNHLKGTLIYSEVEELNHLQILDVSNNRLTGLDNSGILRLPALHQLNCSMNSLTSLPDMSSWSSLITLAAEDNNISELPDGFVTLPKIKTVDFSSNNLRVLDDKIGVMESLDILRISGNPLREKKLSSMATEDLKQHLKARMAPEEEIVHTELEVGEGFYSAEVSPYSTQISPYSPGPSSSDWPVKIGGVLDRSGTQSRSLNPIAAAIASSNAIKVLELHHNMFKEIPSSIAFFAVTLTTLSLAHNELTSDLFLSEELELPVLKELNLSSNTIGSLQPLVQNFKAPQLERLDVSFNRLTSLPQLKSHFPNLISLLASNNTIRELSPDSIRGLRTVDCSDNDINRLEAKIGLLGGPGGLVHFEVKGNRFRVPNYTILEKGTEATLAWLRDKIPVGDQSPTSPTFS